MNIRALLDDSGSIILTKVIREDPHIGDLCNSIETSHRSKRILRIIERGVTRTKDYNVGVMFKASELLVCIMYIYNVIGTMWISKKIGETPMNVHDIVLYAPV
jgi:cysteine sulfinate desulfinase/cysteine desulfurase-like protein